jgi:hypothetical protein
VPFAENVLRCAMKSFTLSQKDLSRMYNRLVKREPSGDMVAQSSSGHVATRSAQESMGDAFEL